MACPSARPEPASAAPASAAPRRSSVRASRSMRLGEDGRQPGADQRGARQRMQIGLVVAVERHTGPPRSGRARSSRSRRSRRGEARASASARRRSRRGGRRRRRPSSPSRRRASRSRPSTRRRQYVVGMETSGSPVAAETAFAVSIALPPPSATRPSAPAACSVAASTPVRSACDCAPWKRPATGRSSARQRSVEISSGRSAPTSSSTSGELGEPPADDHECDRAKARNSSAARLGARPAARTT